MPRVWRFALYPDALIWYVAAFRESFNGPGRAPSLSSPLWMDAFIASHTVLR